MSKRFTWLLSFVSAGALTALVLVGCGSPSSSTASSSTSSTSSTTSSSTTTATATATAAPTVTACNQLPNFVSASPVGDFFGIQFPANTVADGVIPPTAAAGQFQIVGANFCTNNSTTQLTVTGGHGSVAFLAALLFEGWAHATTFPFDGYLQQACSTGTTCFSNTGNNDQLAVQNITDNGHGVISYRLVYASAPPTPTCNSNFTSSPTPGFFPFLTGFTPPVPLPPLSRLSPDSAAGIVGTDICSAGTVASVTTFMTHYLAVAGYTKVASDGRCVYSTECWTSASSALSWNVTDPTNWLIAYHHS